MGDIFLAHFIYIYMGSVSFPSLHIGHVYLLILQDNFPGYLDSVFFACHLNPYKIIKCVCVSNQIKILYIYIYLFFLRPYPT